MVDSGPKAEGQSQGESVPPQKLTRREFLKMGGLLPLIPLTEGLMSREEGGGKEGLGFKKEIDELTDYGFEVYGRLAGGDKIPLGRQERMALDLAMLQMGDWIKNKDWVGILEKVSGVVVKESGLAWFLGLEAKTVARGAKKLAERKLELAEKKLKLAEKKLKLAEREGDELAGPEAKVRERVKASDERAKVSDERAKVSEGVNEKVDELIKKYKIKRVFGISLTARALLGLMQANQQSEELMIDYLTLQGIEGERRRIERNSTISLMMDSGALEEIQRMDAIFAADKEKYGLNEGEWTRQRLFSISKAVESIEKNNHELWEVMESKGGWASLSKIDRVVIIMEEIKQELLQERFLNWEWVGQADLSREEIIELLIADEELKQMVLDYEIDSKDDPYKK